MRGLESRSPLTTCSSLLYLSWAEHLIHPFLGSSSPSGSLAMLQGQ